MNTDPSQAPSGSALPKSKRLLRADTDRASQQAAGYTGDARRMIQSRYHDRWKLALILAVLFGYIALRGQEEPPRKSDRQLIYDLEMRVLALEHENKWEHDRRSPIYKPRGGNIEAQP